MTKYQTKKLDKLWQIRITQAPCLICDDPQSVGHHLLKRRYLNTRWDISNGIPLCNVHHQEAHQDSDNAILSIIGEARYQRLRIKALIVKKHNYQEIKETLE